MLLEELIFTRVNEMREKRIEEKGLKEKRNPIKNI